MGKQKDIASVKDANIQHVRGADPSTVCLALPLFRSHGRYFHDKSLYKKAVESYNFALLVDSEDKSSLKGRGSSYIKLQRYEEALKDAEKALQVDPEDLNALYRKSLALYLMSEYEQSLIFSHRGGKVKRVPVVFDEAILACQETIENCIGRTVGQVLLEQVDSIKKLEKNKIRLKVEERRRIFSKVRTQKTCIDNYADPDEKWHSMRMKKFSWFTYLGAQFAEDYFFSKNLKYHPDVPSAHKKHSRQIIETAGECCHNLLKTEMALRERKPYYSYTYTDPNLREALKNRKQIALKEKMVAAKMTAQNLKKKLETVDKRNLKVMMEAVLRAKDMLDETPPRLLPNKKEYFEFLYDHVSKCYVEALKLFPDRDPERQIRLFYGLHVSGTDYLDDIIRTAYQPYVDNMTIIRDNHNRLKMAYSEMETAWLHHDIGLAHFCANFKLNIARVHAKKCCTVGKKNDNLIWQLLGNMLTSKIEFKLGNYSEAKNNTQTALELSKELGDTDVIDFVDECLYFIEYSRSEEGNLIQKREEKILHLLADENMKQEAAGIFRHIARQPIKKRMSIVPGVKHKIRMNPSYTGTKDSKISWSSRSSGAKINFGEDPK